MPKRCNCRPDYFGLDCCIVPDSSVACIDLSISLRIPHDPVGAKPVDRAVFALSIKDRRERDERRKR